MSQKEYSGVDYVGQKLRESIAEYLSKKLGGEFEVSYGFSEEDDTSTINYSISGLDVELSLTKENKRSTNLFSLSEIVKMDGKLLNDTTSETLKPKRSKLGRISIPYLKKFAKNKIQNLKEFTTRN
ncbi:hypothetical protein CMI38_01660 [Candidatus Pacearchaeota archaeon]|nr:hypothetical protein [Candidatus Pacearchaeota archaeon]|tara:strand:+ start:145 stop:522 length:378 start_codon:yes stop_codon:yes gene_type:complete